MILPIFLFENNYRIELWVWLDSRVSKIKMVSTYRSNLKTRSQTTVNFALSNLTFTTIDELRVEERKERK